MRLILGEQLKSIRKSKKISQEELAEKSGVCMSMISKIERGHNSSWLTVEKLINALDHTYILVDKDSI